jgi:hypothetical protein
MYPCEIKNSLLWNRLWGLFHKEQVFLWGGGHDLKPFYRGALIHSCRSNQLKKSSRINDARRGRWMAKPLKFGSSLLTVLALA